MVKNNGDESIVVGLMVRAGTIQNPRSATHWNGLWTPETRPAVVEVKPSTTRLFTELVKPEWGAPIGDYAYRVDVCVVALKQANLHGFYKKGYIQDPCGWIGGSQQTFQGTVFLRDPRGPDADYFEKYVDQAYFSTDRKGAKRASERLKRDFLLHKEELWKINSRPFEEYKSQAWWVELRANSFSAQMAGLEARIDDVDKFVHDSVNLAKNPNQKGYREDFSSSSVVEARNEADRSLYLTQYSDLAWQPYLKAVTRGYLGTRDEIEGIEAIEQVASFSPDCATREIAERILESIYE
jgi:hypothetical protein